LQPTRANGSVVTSGSAQSDGDSSGEVLFSDGFEDNQYSDRWEFLSDNEPDDETVQESDGALHHVSSRSYNHSGRLYTIEEFPAEGKIMLQARARTRESDYWGYGFGFQFEEKSVYLKEHKWERYNRFGIGGVVDRPPEYESDYRTNPNFAKLAPATSRTEYVKYSMTIDMNRERVTEVTRGSARFELALNIGAVGDTFRIRFPEGRGHDIELDSITLRDVSDAQSEETTGGEGGSSAPSRDSAATPTMTTQTQTRTPTTALDKQSGEKDPDASTEQGSTDENGTTSLFTRFGEDLTTPINIAGSGVLGGVAVAVYRRLSDDSNSDS
jgi:hypothetical protein